MGTTPAAVPVGMPLGGLYLIPEWEQNLNIHDSGIDQNLQKYICSC